MAKRKRFAPIKLSFIEKLDSIDKKIIVSTVIVLMLTLISYNFEGITGQIIIKNIITTYPQEKENVIREIKLVDSPMKRNIIFYVVNLKSDDPINTAKEKAVIYRKVRGNAYRELTKTMECVDGASKCDKTKEERYITSLHGLYLIEIERGSSEEGKYIKEIIGKKEVYIPA